MTPDRQSELSWRWLVGLFGLAVLLDLIAGLPVLPIVRGGGLIGPDSYMRLVRIRDGLALGGFTDIVAADGGSGTYLYWSHLLDAVILCLHLPLRLVLDEEPALRWAGAIIGPLSVGLLGSVAAWAVAPLAGRGWAWLATVLVCASSAVLCYGVIGCVHHHVSLAAVAAAVAGWAGRAACGQHPGRAGRWLAAWSAIGIWLSPETMPFILMGFGAIGLAWLLHPDSRAAGRELRWGGSLLLVLVATLLAIDPPREAVMIDRLSVVYLVLASALCGLGWSLWIIERRAGPHRRRLFGTAAALGWLSAWIALFPAVIRGPGGLMSPEDAAAFFSQIVEMQPVTDWASGVNSLATGVLACLVASVLEWRDRANPERMGLWAYAVLCGVVLVALGVLHVRFAIYPAVAGALMAPVAVGRLARWHQQASGNWAVVARHAVLGCFLVLPAMPRWLGNGSAARDAARHDALNPSCSLAQLGHLLDKYAGQTVLANVNDTPELLYRTRLHTVGSLYHRGLTGYRRWWDAWHSSPSNDVPDAVRATGATLVLMCPGATDQGGNALYNVLRRGEPPGWLQRQPVPVEAGYDLYQLDPSPQVTDPARVVSPLLHNNERSSANIRLTSL